MCESFAFRCVGARPSQWSTSKVIARMILTFLFPLFCTIFLSLHSLYLFIYLCIDYVSLTVVIQGTGNEWSILSSSHWSVCIYYSSLLSHSYYSFVHACICLIIHSTILYWFIYVFICWFIRLFIHANLFIYLRTYKHLLINIEIHVFIHLLFVRL